MKLAYYGCTHTGLARANNEDAILMRTNDDAGLFLVADGIGGAESGEIVSGMLRDRYDQWWEHEFLPSSRKLEFRQHLDKIRELLMQINRDAVQRFGEWKSGSTIVLLFIFGTNYACISSGDSRIYRMRGFSLQQITKDDTYGNLIQNRNNPDSDMAARKLVGAVGISSQLRCSIRTDRLHMGERFFLCSDGVYGYITPRILQKRLILDGLIFPPRKAAERICRDIVMGGAGDNYSMIFVKNC